VGIPLDIALACAARFGIHRRHASSHSQTKARRGAAWRGRSHPSTTAFSTRSPAAAPEQITIEDRQFAAMDWRESASQHQKIKAVPARQQLLLPRKRPGEAVAGRVPDRRRLARIARQHVERPPLKTCSTPARTFGTRSHSWNAVVFLTCVVSSSAAPSM